MAKRGCIVLVIIVVIFFILASSRAPRSTARPTAADTDAAPQGIASPVPSALPATVATLDDAGRAIVATQQFFIQQQTQAAGGGAVDTPAPVMPTFQPEAIETMMIYAQGSVNVRACPDTDCALVGPLMPGQAVTAVGMVKGEAVRADNTTWYQVDYYGHDGFVYSEFISQQPPTAAPTPRPTSAPISVAPAQSAYQPVCNGIDDLNCVDFCGHLQDAQIQADACGNEDQLDGGRDSDRRACEVTAC